MMRRFALVFAATMVALTMLAVHHVQAAEHERGQVALALDHSLADMEQAIARGLAKDAAGSCGDWRWAVVEADHIVNAFKDWGSATAEIRSLDVEGLKAELQKAAGPCDRARWESLHTRVREALSRLWTPGERGIVAVSDAAPEDIHAALSILCGD